MHRALTPLVALPALILMPGLAPRAHACLCAQSVSDSTVWPRPDRPAAVNTKVLVLGRDLTGGERKVVLHTANYAPPPPPRKLKRLKALEQRRGDGGRGQPRRWDLPPIDATTRSGVAGSQSWVELTPRAPLAPGATFKIVLVDAKRTRVLAEFTTGETKDVSPPAWQGDLRASLQFSKDDAMCGSGQHFLGLTVGAVSDPDANEAPWAVWMGTKDQRPDPSAPPRTFARRAGPRGPLVLGRSSNCVPDNIGLPKDVTGRWLAIAPLDQAGNMAKPRFVRITASEPGE